MPYNVEYTVWEKPDAGNSERDTGERRTFEGFYDEPTPVDCVNAILYEIRGTKSKWELAYVNEVEEVE